MAVSRTKPLLTLNGLRLNRLRNIRILMRFLKMRTASSFRAGSVIGALKGCWSLRATLGENRIPYLGVMSRHAVSRD